MKKIMGKNSPKKLLRQGFVIVAGLSFFWFSAASVVEMMVRPNNTMNEPVEEQALSEKERLKKEIEGYQSVLNREPNNTFALEKIVEIHLTLGELEKALPFMEKLVKIQPENERYQEVLSLIKQGLASQEKENTPPPKENNQEK